MIDGALPNHVTGITMVLLVVFHETNNVPSCTEDSPFACVAHNECYNKEQRCDGTVHCTDGTDEHSMFFTLNIN